MTTIKDGLENSNTTFGDMELEICKYDRVQRNINLSYVIRSTPGMSAKSQCRLGILPKSSTMVICTVLHGSNLVDKNTGMRVQS